MVMMTLLLLCWVKNGCMERMAHDLLREENLQISELYERRYEVLSYTS